MGGRECARHCLALLAKLNQAEQLLRDAIYDLAQAVRQRDDLEARLAKVPALMDAARQLLSEVDQGGEATDGSIALLEEILADWEAPQ